MKEILIFTYLQRHLKKMFPIIDEIRKNSDIVLTVILMTQEEQAMAVEHDIEYKMLDEFTEKKRLYDFDLGWGLEPLINAIDRINPDLFIAIEVNYILRNAIRYCHEKKIKSIVVQHGAPNKYSMHAFVPFEGDLFLAWGAFSGDVLAKRNMPKEKIILTGGIPFDRTLSLVPDRNSISRILSLDPGKKWILFTTQGSGSGNMPTPDEIRSGVVETAEALANNEDVQLIYQVHPSQNIDLVTELLDGLSGGNCMVCRYRDTEELISASDAMITFFSTTAIDAVLLRKPLMLINLSDDRDFFPFVQRGAAIGAYEKEDIRPSLDRLMSGFVCSDEVYEELADYINYKNDGKALSRVMDIIYKNMGV